MSTREMDRNYTVQAFDCDYLLSFELYVDDHKFIYIHKYLFFEITCLICDHRYNISTLSFMSTIFGIYCPYIDSKYSFIKHWRVTKSKKPLLSIFKIL